MPPSTSVNRNVTELSVLAATAKSPTVPGALADTVTATVAEPLCPSLVAVIVAEPTATPFTRPVPLTVATPPSLLVHVTARPLNGLLLASSGVAVSCSVCPAWTLAVAGLTLTEATGTTVTDTVAVPLCPSLVAVIVTEPAATPLTTPPLTVATPALLLAQVTERPLNAVPLASLGVAVSWTACPAWTLAVAGLTLTEATGTAVTDTVAVPLYPSLVAVIVAAPTAAALTTPVPLTMATPALLLAHVMARPASVLPFASWSVATSETVPPTVTVTAPGATLSDATGGGDGSTTVTAAESRLLPLLARIKRPPAARPRTTPAELTVASPLFVLVQLTELGGRLFDIMTLALSCRLSPTSTVALCG